MSVLSYGEFPSQQSSGKEHPPKGVPQFKAPLRFQSGVQSGTLLEQDQRRSTPGSTSSKEVSQFKAPLRLQSGVQSGKLLEQDQPYSASGALPLSPLEALRQRQSSQFLRESERSWQPALPRTDARVRSEALRRTKAHVTMKVILMGGTVLLMGGIASFLLLRFPTYLVVTWAILIIVFSNLVSRELRSYYQPMPTTLRIEAEYPSTISPSHGVDMGRDPVLKDISDTTGYLKALSLAFTNDHPTQTFLPEKEYKV